jgi:putative transcriptional regulator
MKSIKGYLLVASPKIKNSIFEKSTILILEHSNKGAYGIIIDKYQRDTTIEEVWEKSTGYKQKSNQLLNIGGPIDGPIISIHTNKKLGEEYVANKVYFTVAKKIINEIIKKEKTLKVFVGYCRWSNGQIEQEIESGSWFIFESKLEYIFNLKDSLWNEILDTEYLKILKKSIKNIPLDPSLN